MLKSIMEFVDVLFPLNLGPLTYKCPDNLVGKAQPGMLVSAPLKKQIARGIILGRQPKPVSGEIKTISEIPGDSPLLEPPVMKLLDWMSDYYISNKGIVLKNMLPDVAFKKVTARKKQPSEISPQLPAVRQKIMSGIEEDILIKINESALKKEYKTFLVHTPTSFYETSLALKLIGQKRNAIILVPEIAHLNNILPSIREIAGDRLCVLHSGLSRGARSEAYEKIMSGECHTVVGTRSAVFAPVKNLSLILVMQEHGNSYKTEEGLRFNARDVAVMRGYLEKATVLLSSISPSIESFYNAKLGKYSLIEPDPKTQRPRIKIVNMYEEKQPVQNISKTVIEAANSTIKKNGKIMFVLNRKGYSLLTCKECGSTEVCGRCDIPMIFHKSDKSLRCHYCGHRSAPPDRCTRCGSFKVELSGAGIQRIEESLKKFFNIEPLRLDSDRIKRRAGHDEIAELIKGETIILGTRLLTKRLHPEEGFEMGAVLNADTYINLPDFRAPEKAYQELSSIADKVKPEGRVFLQTRMPQSYVFRHLRSHDYASFCEEELKKRKELSYPPFSRLAIITFKGEDYDGNKVKNLAKKICEADEGIEILGPSLTMTKKGLKEYALLLKSASKTKLHSSAREFLKVFGGYKDLKIDVAVDP